MTIDRIYFTQNISLFGLRDPLQTYEAKSFMATETLDITCSDASFATCSYFVGGNLQQVLVPMTQVLQLVLKPEPPKVQTKGSNAKKG